MSWSPASVPGPLAARSYRLWPICPCSPLPPSLLAAFGRLCSTAVSFHAHGTIHLNPCNSLGLLESPIREMSTRSWHLPFPFPLPLAPVLAPVPGPLPLALPLLLPLHLCLLYHWHSILKLETASSPSSAAPPPPPPLPPEAGSAGAADRFSSSHIGRWSSQRLPCSYFPSPFPHAPPFPLPHPRRPPSPHTPCSPSPCCSPSTPAILFPLPLLSLSLHPSLPLSPPHLLPTSCRAPPPSVGAKNSVVLRRRLAQDRFSPSSTRSASLLVLQDRARF